MKMRWLKWGLVAGWLGVHAWLWTLLPPVPRWSLSGFEANGTGVTPDGLSLVTSDRTTVNVFNLADGKLVNSWPRPSGPARGLVDLVVAPIGRRAIVYDRENGLPVLIELDTGRRLTMPPLSVPPDVAVVGGTIQASLAFAPDARTYVQLTLLPDDHTPGVFIKDLMSETERIVRVENQPVSLHCSADGRTVLVSLRDAVSGNWRIELIDLMRAVRVGSFNVGPVYTIQHMGVSTNRDVAAVNAVRVQAGQMNTEIQLWDLSTSQHLAVVPDMLSAGWNANGLLVAGHFSGSDPTGIDGMRLLDKAGNEVANLPAAPEGPVQGRMGPGGQYLINFNVRSLPAWQRWLHGAIYGRAPEWESGSVMLYDARSGGVLANIEDWSPMQAVHGTPDGRTLVVSSFGKIHVWDIPPNTPHGIVLGLMIVEVGLALAWTAWRRRASRRKAVPV